MMTAGKAPMFTIGEFTMADYEAVNRLWEQTGLWMRPSDAPDQVRLKLARDPDLFLVARDSGGRPVAVVMGGWDGRRAYIYHLSVEEAWQRRGVAGALLDELEDRLRAKGALKVKIQIMHGNEASRAFFVQRGYELESDCVPYGKELVPGGAPSSGC